MSKNTIAVIQLAPGEVGYYDELSRIHLTIGHPTEAVEAGTNCTQLRHSVRSGRLRLVSGSLGAEVPPFKFVKRGERYFLAHNDNAAPSIVVAKPKEETAEVKAVEVPAKAEAVKEEPVIEEVKETKKSTKKAKAEEAVTEEAPAKEEKKQAKKTTKKAKKDDAEENAAE